MKKKIFWAVSAILALLLAVNIIILICMSNLTARAKHQLELSQRYLEEMEYEEAIAAFEKAIAIDPKLEEAYIGLADVYIALEDYESALTILEQGYEETEERSLSRKMMKVQEMMPQEKKVETEVTAVEIETQEVQETEVIVEEKAVEDSTAEITQEEYCYAILLRDMMNHPNIYWPYKENIPENNRFAVIDINDDGVKELLVEYDSCAADRDEEFKYIDIYQYNNNMCTIMAQGPEFYKDGTIIDIYISEYKKSHAWILNNYEDVSVVDIIDNSKLPCAFDDEFPTEMDTDGDGIVYIWYDYVNDYPTERQYISEEEYNARLAKERRGKERVNITWDYITEENIDKLIPA